MNHAELVALIDLHLYDETAAGCSCGVGKYGGGPDYSEHLAGLIEAGALPSVDPRTVKHGLYRIWWRSGGDSVAAVGIAENGDRWIAATNWVEHTSTDWSEVIRIEPIR